MSTSRSSSFSFKHDSTLLAYTFSASHTLRYWTLIRGNGAAEDIVGVSTFLGDGQHLCILPVRAQRHAASVTAYFDLLSYLYLSRLIHDVSLIIPELSVLPDHLYRSYICTRAHVNTYRTYPLSRYSATILLNACTRVSATYLPIPYRHSHARSPSWSTHSESYPSLYL